MLQKLIKSIVPCGKQVKVRSVQSGAKTANHYEKLESRTVLSTFLVQNLSDRGAGSLRAAVEQANSNPGSDVIRFQRGLQGIIGLVSGQLEITDPLRIQGPGESALTVSGSSLSRVFKVNTKSGEVFLRGMTIANGLSSQLEDVGIRVVRGGGILNLSSQLRLQDLTFKNNRAEDYGTYLAADVVGGGAIANSEYAKLRASHCTFVSNSAKGGTRYAFGGAIASVTSSQALITNSAFTSNQVSGGSVNYGGAVATFGGSKSEIRQAEFVSNKALGLGVQKAFGGALAARPGTVQLTSSEIVADNCRFVGNSAEASDAFEAGGGAIYSYQSAFTVERSKLLGNWATAYNASGGGIQNDQSDGLVRDCQINSNQAVGVHSPEGRSYAFGGGIASKRGASLTVSKSELALNEARGVKAFGGGIFNGIIAGSGSALLTIDRSSIRQNLVATTLDSTAALAQGGGIFNGNPEEVKTSNAIVQATRSRIERNSALAQVGGQGVGGGVYTVGLFTVDQRLQRQLIDGIAGNFATTSNDDLFGELILA